jgi:hypothetical protein
MRKNRNAISRVIPRVALLTLLLAFGARPSSASSPAVPAFVVDGGTQVTLSGSTQLTLDRSLLNFGTFTPAPGSAVVIDDYALGQLLGVPQFADLAVVNADTMSLGSASQVNGTLTLGLGILTLAGHDLVANAVTGGSAASYVMTPDTLGRLARTVGSGAPVAFPIGNSSYDPMTIRTGTGSDVFRVAVMDSPPTSGLVPATALSRAWAIAHPNASGVNGNLALSVEWNAIEQGAQFDRSLSPPTGAWAWRWLGGTWVPQPGVRVSDNGGANYPAIDGLVTPNAGLWTLAGVGQLLAAPPDVLPKTLELAPAMPNPARGASLIRFGLPARAHVSLAIYSLQGQRIATLIDGEQEAGYHMIRFERASLAQGVYFCKLESNGGVRTSRLVWLGR